jgi:hypothetical protein
MPLARRMKSHMKININTPSNSYKHSDDANVWARTYIRGFICKNNAQKRTIQLCRHNYWWYMVKLSPMRPKHVVRNNYSIVKYWLIINHFVVVTANQIIYVWHMQQDAHCKDNYWFMDLVDLRPELFVDLIHLIIQTKNYGRKWVL